MRNTSYDEVFPSLPNYYVNWAPIYMEPIIGSGEKITIAVAAIDGDKNPTVVPILDSKRTKCLFDDKAASFTSLVSLCIDSLKNHLNETQNINEWAPPLEGVSLGITRILHSISIDSAIQLIIQKSAFMGNPDSVMVSEKILQEKRDAEDLWGKQIKEIVVRTNPDFIKKFNKKFRVTQGARETEIDFWGVKYAANFGKLIPGRGLSQTVRSSKVKLWDLASLKDFEKIDSPLINQFSNEFRLNIVELILWKPSTTDLAYTDRDFKFLEEAFEEIKVEGENKGIGIQEFTGDNQPQKAAERIVQKEAA